MRLDDNDRLWVDMHTHSTASDGTFSPRELVNYAEEKELYAIALTDHDTIDGIEEALEVAKNTSVKIIPGIELSAEYGTGDLHILGLNIDYQNKGFLKVVEMCRESRDERNRKMIEKIRQQGMPLTEEIMEERFGIASVTRAHFARYMIDEGFVSSKEEAFQRYLNPGKCCYVARERITPKMAIELILDAGGYPVLAHPLLYKMGHDRLYSTVNYLKELGLQGLEGIYSLNTPSDDRKLADLAKNYGLYITGGSDFHGSNKPDIDLGVGKGNLRVPKNLLKNIGFLE